MKPEEIYDKRILISVLNWGFGHVSRSIGLVGRLLLQNNEVIIACDELQRNIFEQYFDKVQFIQHEGYPFTFGGKGNFDSDLLKSLVRLQKRQKKETFQVTQYCKEYSPDLIISDHRYGFRSAEVTSVFVTHQLHLPVKWYQKFIQTWHSALIHKFNLVWVMDYPDSRLAGKLSASDGFRKPIYIGPYSRFMDDIIAEEKSGEVLIASGPDIYAKQLIDAEFNNGMKMICSSRVAPEHNEDGIINNWREQDEVIRNAAKIISRSGYSTIMDNEFLKTEMLLIPTPGQSEQEYLYSLLNK